MDEEKWMAFIHDFWGTLSYWKLIKLYQANELSGSFFMLSALATRNELLMRIAHTVHLCEEIAKEYDVGADAEKALQEIRKLYAQGDTPNRSALNFEDCGVKPYRDKILAHPLDTLKEILGKGRYEISLKWETVEKTLDKIREFANEVEAHYTEIGKWDFETHKDVGGIEIGFDSLMIAMKDAAKYDRLKLAVRLKGRSVVVYDRQADEIVVEEGTEPNGE